MMRRGRKRKSFCRVRTNHHNRIVFVVTWDKVWKEAAGREATPENLAEAEGFAAKVSKLIEQGKFNKFVYLRLFPDGNRVSEFRPPPPVAPKSLDTVSGFFAHWESTLAPPKVRVATGKQYRSSIQKHVLPFLGQRKITDLRWTDLAGLQDQLQQSGVGPAAINRALHHALRSMFRDAVRLGMTVAQDLFDSRLWKRVREDTRPPDPYSVEERQAILEHFRGTPWYPFVYFSFWQGTRPSEAIALRRSDVDLVRATVSIRRSRVNGKEDRTKTKKSERTVRLYAGTVQVLKEAWPDDAKEDDYLFTTQTGAPITQDNFYDRVWVPALTELGVRLRKDGFYQTRHTYVSYMLSIGKKVAFVAEQVGDSIQRIETTYKKYFASDDDLLIPEMEAAAVGINGPFSRPPEAKGQEIRSGQKKTDAA